MGLTESLDPHAGEHASCGAAVPDERAVIAECIAEIGFATTVQTRPAQFYLDTPYRRVTSDPSSPTTDT
jgi:hypothetical protein